jgi:hypothetical protein
MENAQILASTARPLAPVKGAPGKAGVANRPIRSAVTNGTRAYVIGDGNSRWARRQRDLIALHLADLGGEERLSENQLSLCRRAATLETELEILERRGRDIPPDSDVVAHFRRRPRRVDAE